MLQDETEQGKVYFPGNLVPYLDHPLVRDLAPRTLEELRVRHLYQFLLATTHLETRVVNRGAERIANNRIGIDVSPATRLDAFKVYCDEGYHSLYSLDLVRQVEAATAIAAPDWDFGGFADRLDATAGRLLPGEPVLAQLLQVVVFETLITGVLNELPNDTTVVTTVRDIARDHARDEGRHHRFFSRFFHDLWSALDSGLRDRAAPVLPALIEDCLLWDVHPVRRSLSLAGLTPADVETVIADAYGGARDIRQSASATVRMCRSAGVLDVPGARESFADKGLISDD
ncbi:diiron oxygenase [Streptosporangium sp. NPDC000396]|uniref:diiron oxygenase n=1 Tax=Streptosporangium sp. NPDC000396 TaxID=3366185 RepID=UPI0036883948